MWMLQNLAVSLAGFEAVLEIGNESGNLLSDITLEFFIYNEITLEETTLEFAIAPPSLNGFSPTSSPSVGNDSAIAFSIGDLFPGNTGRAAWILIPTDAAAEGFPLDLGGVPYSVGGRVRYTENELQVEVPLTPDSILVLPRPSLQIGYLE